MLRVGAGVGEHSEIVRPIICAIVVVMMDNLPAFQMPTDLIFSY